MIRLLTSRRRISGLDLLSGFGIDRYGGNPGNIRCTAFCFNRMVLHGICLKNYICVTVSFYNIFQHNILFHMCIERSLIYK